jgi:antitoxin component of MazEF toxin-antitoxin module
MIKKLTKLGDDKAIVLDEAILQLLNITEKTKLTLHIEGTSIIITPVNTKTCFSKENSSVKVSKNEKIQKAYEKIIKKYSKDLEKLAKN